MILKSQIWFNTAKFVQQQYLWYIAIQPVVGCYTSWANIRYSGCSPLGEISLWNGTIKRAIYPSDIALGGATQVLIGSIQPTSP